jgi:hypothetical protein
VTFPWTEPDVTRLQLPFTRDQASNLYTSAGSATAAITFAASPRAGSTVLAAVANTSGTPVLTDNGAAPTVFTVDVSNRNATYNIHIFRASGITLPAAGGAYQINVTSGGSTFAAGAVSYVAPFGALLGSDLQNVTGTAPHGTAKGMLVFAAFSDSNPASHTVALAGPVFTPQFTSPAGGSNLGAFGAADFLGYSAPAAQACTWTLGASSSWEAAVAGYLPAQVIGANAETSGTLTADGGVRVKEGPNAKQGTATLSSGAVVVSNTSVTATSRIFLTAQDNSTTGALRVSARTAGTSFTITSSSGTDSGAVAFQIFEPG